MCAPTLRRWTKVVVTDLPGLAMEPKTPLRLKIHTHDARAAPALRLGARRSASFAPSSPGVVLLASSFVGGDVGGNVGGDVGGDVGFSAIIVRVMRYSNLVRSTNLLGGGRLLVSLQTQAGQGSRAAGHPRPKGAAGFVIAGGNVTLEDLRAASKPFVPSDRPINSSDRSDAAILLDALLVRVSRISRPADWRTPRCPFQR